MRLVYLTMCAAALVACSDVQSPTAPPTPPHAVPGGKPSEPGASPENFDPRSLTQRIEGLVTENFARVSLPPDAFSQSADAVHPDIACPGGGWNGGKCWFMYTPYKNSDPSWENPGFLLALDDTNWVTPSAIRNPIVSFPGVGAYNSDPDHAFDPATGRLIQIFRVVADTTNRIMLMSTANARQWTTPVLAFAAHSHDVVSPSLIIENDRTATVWYIKSGVAGCNAFETSLEMRTAHPEPGQSFENAVWTSAIPVELTIPGYVPWHIDVAKLPFGGYVALVAAFQRGTACGQSDLWLAGSDDGLKWRTLPLPLFWRGMSTAKSRKISTWYRGTIRYDAQSDQLDIWPSALAGPNWTIYHTAIRLRELSDLMGAARISDLRAVIAATKTAPRATIPMP